MQLGALSVQLLKITTTTSLQNSWLVLCKLVIIVYFNMQMPFFAIVIKSHDTHPVIPNRSQYDRPTPRLK